jgi:hypothetical protein
VKALQAGLLHWYLADSRLFLSLLVILHHDAPLHSPVLPCCPDSRFRGANVPHCWYGTMSKALQQTYNILLFHCQVSKSRLISMTCVSLVADSTGGRGTSAGSALAMQLAPPAAIMSQDLLLMAAKVRAGMQFEVPHDCCDPLAKHHILLL